MEEFWTAPSELLVAQDVFLREVRRKNGLVPACGGPGEAKGLPIDSSGVQAPTA